MAIRGVIFDLGHTLMVLDGTWPEVFERGVTHLSAFLEQQGLGLDGAAFGRALLDRRKEGFARARATRREVTAEESMRWTFARFGLPDPDPRWVQGAIAAFFAFEGRRWHAEPQAGPLLRELAGRGLRLGMFSNATHDPFIQAVVDRFGFRPWLKPALTSAGTGIRKPDPAAFQPILAAWGLPPDTVAMVGDTLEEDIVGAQLAGMRTVWICARGDARQEGNRVDGTLAPAAVVPDATISRLEDLPGCLAKL